LTGVELNHRIPENQFYSHYGPDYSLHPQILETSSNKNTRAYLENIAISIMEQLRSIPNAPSVQLQKIPPPVPTYLFDSEVILNKFRWM
jgi:hypothetical protein